MYGQTGGTADARPFPSPLASGGVIGRSTTDQVKRVLVLDEISQRVNETNDALRVAVGDLRDLLDDILGGEPDANGKDASNISPTGRVHGLSTVTSHTVMIAVDLRQQIERLRRL